MYLYKGSFKDDIRESFLESIQEEIYQNDLEDVDTEEVLSRITDKYDYAHMTEYIEENLEYFNLEEDQEKLIEKMAIYLVEEELPKIEEEILEETDSEIDDFISHKLNNDIDY